MMPQISNTAPPGVVPSALDQQGAYETDETGVLGVFYSKEVQDPQQTEIAGHPVFTLVPFVKMRFPNDRQSEPHERVTEEHMRRWPRAWAAFERGQTGLAQGTAIEQFPLLNRAQVATLRAVGVLSVEMLANVPDSRLNMTITHDLRERARQWLADASDVEQELRGELAEAKTTIANMDARIAQLEDSLRAAQSQPKPEVAAPVEQPPEPELAPQATRRRRRSGSRKAAA